jgi:hypothetical protein
LILDDDGLWRAPLHIGEFAHRHEIHLGGEGGFLIEQLADGINEETRLWHRDDEDFRITKIIVYLNDVDAEGGPFEYIPKYHTPDIRLLRFTAGRVLDEHMRQVVPESKWKSCQGPAGTVLFADPCNFFHRGKIPTKQDRFTLFYGYNSRNPFKPEYCQPLFSKQAFLRRVPSLTDYQKSCISEQ